MNKKRDIHYQLMQFIFNKPEELFDHEIDKIIEENSRLNQVEINRLRYGSKVYIHSSLKPLHSTAALHESLEPKMKEIHDAHSELMLLKIRVSSYITNGLNLCNDYSEVMSIFPQIFNILKYLPTDLNESQLEFIESNKEIVEEIHQQHMANLLIQ